MAGGEVTAGAMTGLPHVEQNFASALSEEPHVVQTSTTFDRSLEQKESRPTLSGAALVYIKES